MVITNPTEARTRNRQLVRQYRSKHRRYDYYVDADARVSIERLMVNNPTLSISDIINALVEAGFKSLFPAGQS
jgi:hypothetical protein